MSLKDCLLSAVDQGAISREEATFLSDEFDNRFAQSRLSLGDTQAAADARATLEKALRGAAIEKKRRADLTEAARLNVLGRLTGEATRDGRADAFSAAMGLLSHYGFGPDRVYAAAPRQSLRPATPRWPISCLPCVVAAFSVADPTRRWKSTWSRKCTAKPLATPRQRSWRARCASLRGSAPALQRRRRRHRQARQLGHAAHA
jgi:hypothetical protein